MNPDCTDQAFALLDCVQAGVMVRTLDGVIRYWNAAASQLYGLTAEQVTGRSLQEVFPTTELIDPNYWLTNDLEQNETVRRHADGRLIPLHTTCSLRRDSNGQALYLVETATETKPRTISGMTLERSEYRYRNMFNAMAASFWELDFSAVGAMLRELHAAGVEDVPFYLRNHPDFVHQMMCATRVVDVNEQTLNLFGRGDKQEILAATIEVFWPPASVEVYADAVCSALAGDSSFVRETRLRRIDGSEFDALFTCAFPPENLAKGLLMTGVLDLSARNQAFAALERMRSDFAHSARVSMLGELMASIAHEVNQPLAAIRTNGEAGLRWLALPRPNVEEVRLLAERIVNDAQRASTIISRIRSMARHSPAERSWHPVSHLIQEALQFLHAELQGQGVKTLLQLSARHAHIHVDRILMQQVLVNLILNAVQAMSSVDTPQKELSIGTRMAGDVLHITVSDNGPGIAPDHFEQLFESFFSTKATGMGMGLPICRSIIESFDASIQAESAPMGGACFRIVMPANEIERGAQASKSLQESSLETPFVSLPGAGTAGHHPR